MVCFKRYGKKKKRGHQGWVTTKWYRKSDHYYKALNSQQTGAPVCLCLPELLCFCVAVERALAPLLRLVLYASLWVLISVSNKKHAYSFILNIGARALSTASKEWSFCVSVCDWASVFLCCCWESPGTNVEDGGMCIFLTACEREGWKGCIYHHP